MTSIAGANVICITTSKSLGRWGTPSGGGRWHCLLRQGSQFACVSSLARWGSRSTRSPDTLRRYGYSSWPIQNGSDLAFSQSEAALSPLVILKEGPIMLSLMWIAN